MNILMSRNTIKIILGDSSVGQEIAVIMKFPHNNSNCITSEEK
jgi:hypothetical protein